MRSRWLLSGTVAVTTSLALVATLPGSARAVGESSEIAVVAVAEARAKSLAEDMARTERLARSQAQAQAAKAKVEEHHLGTDRVLQCAHRAGGPRDQPALAQASRLSRS